MLEILDKIAHLKVLRVTTAEVLAQTDAELDRAYREAHQAGARIDLLDWIEAYLRTSDTAATVLGRKVLGDPKFVSDLRAGRSLGRKTEDRVLYYLAQAA